MPVSLNAAVCIFCAGQQCVLPRLLRRNPIKPTPPRMPLNRIYEFCLGPGLATVSAYQQQIAFQGLTSVLVAAIILVVLLLSFLYDSYGVTIAMLITTLLAVAAVYIGLWITGTEFNITSRMGMTMIVGIVTEVPRNCRNKRTDL